MIELKLSIKYMAIGLIGVILTWLISGDFFKALGVGMVYFVCSILIDIMMGMGLISKKKEAGR